MRKILFVISGMGANGAERVMSLLVNHGAESGMQIELALISSDIVEYELNESVKVHFLSRDLPKGRIQAAFARLLRLRRCIKSFKPDIVVSFLTACNVYACFANIGLNIPVIVSERNDPVRDCPSKIRRFIRNTSYRFADGFIFQTEEASQAFSNKIKGKSVVIPNPVKNQLPLAKLEEREKTIVAAGRLTSQKNYPMMLEAFSLFYKGHPAYKLLIYGEGEEKAALMELAEELGVSSAVEFKGLVSDLHEKITRAGMFVLSSDYEGISNSLLESLAMGLPCISTDCPCGGSRHLIDDGVNGLLVPVGDIEEMAEAMRTIADSDDLAMRLGNKARETRKTHSADVILKHYYDFIEGNIK